MRRLSRVLRAIAGVACLLCAGYWLVEAIRPPRTVSIDWDGRRIAGNPYGVRIVPLTRAERAAALELEARLLREWLQ